MTVREYIQNEIYALEDAKRSMEDLVAKLKTRAIDFPNDDYYGVDYDGHVFYEITDHITALQQIVIPGLQTLISSNREDLRTFSENMLDMDLLRMRRV